MTDPAEILPCPFCGDAMQLSDGIVAHIVQTPRCPIDMMGFQMNRVDWNRRALPAADTSALGAVVKPLVWRDQYFDAEDNEPNYSEAEGAGYGYSVGEFEGGFWSGDTSFPTMAEAKADREKVYVARIRDALEPPTHAAQLAAALALPEVAALRTAQAARVLLDNMPGEHQCWADLQDAVDEGKDEDDCIRAWLRAIALEARHD